MGVKKGSDFGDKVRSKTAPAGRPVGPPRGGSCYLDNIEITEAKRETLSLRTLAPGGLGGVAPQFSVFYAFSKNF